MKSLSLRLVSRCNPVKKVELHAVNTMKSSLKKKPWIRIVGWASVATGAVAVGFFVGRNLRARYLLNHRTPYDYYAHAGDNGNGVEYGVGI
jgi:hypothetical protein